jgi:histidyl-tRNA synthetase
MLKPRPISGFPEWLPNQKLVEQRFLDTIRRVYELYGYTPLETAAAERVEVLAAKGEVDKEIYALVRLQDPGHPPELALHFDLTVPLARYVAQHYGQLTFPFKRYQIQKVWRGERPQEGRFREFYQADIDVIAEDRLPLHFDAEMPAVAADIFHRLGLKTEIRVNNRKVLLGYYRGLGLADDLAPALLRELDKLEKTGAAAVMAGLQKLGLDPDTARRCLALAGLQGPPAQVLAQARDLGAKDPLFQEGLEELAFVTGELGDLPPDQRLVLHLGTVRGLDYYTGTIYETVLPDYPGLGSVCSGGRYDNLASEFIHRRLPGVGISIGLTRLLACLLPGQKLERHTPTEVLVILPAEEFRPACRQIARSLRERGLPTEVYHEPARLDKQLRYADRKGIPWALFPHRWESGRVEVKNLATREQTEVALEAWSPS